MSLPTMRTAASLPLLGLISALGVVVFADEVAAQQPIAPFTIQKILRTPGPLSAADAKTLDTYLKRQVFGALLKGGNGLPGIRKDFGNIVRGVDKTPAHDFLTDKACKYASFLAGPGGKKFKPVARYNAMLLLGDLNENDAANQIKPLPDALPHLYKAILLPPDSDDVFLKPAALIGITRFARENGLPPRAIPAITEALLKIVNQADPPAGRSASANNFIRRGAARALAAIGSPGPKNEVLNAFADIAADAHARITLRCEMSQFIGELKIPPNSGADLKGLANTIGHQTVEICQQELDRATAAKEPPSRRILMYALDSGYLGLSGLARSAETNAEAAKFIGDVKNKTYSLYKMLDNTEQTPDEQIAEKVGPEIDSIEGLLLAKPAAAAPMVAVGPTDAATQPVKTN